MGCPFKKPDSHISFGVPVRSQATRTHLSAQARCGMERLREKWPSLQLACVRVAHLLAGEQVWAHLAGERQCGGHLFHGQVPDARGQRASAGRTAAELLSARVADQVTRLALQDGRQDVVEAYRALEQRRKLGGLSGQTGRGQGGWGSRHRPGHRAHTGCIRGGAS